MAIAPKRATLPIAEVIPERSSELPHSCAATHRRRTTSHRTVRLVPCAPARRSPARFGPKRPRPCREFTTGQSTLQSR
jgi:hypothetical protein